MDTDGIVSAIEIGGVFTSECRVTAEEWVLGVVAFTEWETSLVCRRAYEASGSAGWLSLRDCVGGERNEEGGKDGKRKTHFVKECGWDCDG
jgi:hypothetical protein